MSIEEFYMRRDARKYNEMKGNYEESIRKRMKLLDENERLKYEFETAELHLREVIRERDILRMTLKWGEVRVENMSSQETLAEKLNKMSDKRDALQEVVDELRMQNERERTRVHKLTIERDAGRRLIKEYMEALKDLEDKTKRLQPPQEDELW